HVMRLARNDEEDGGNVAERADVEAKASLERHGRAGARDDILRGALRGDPCLAGQDFRVAADRVVDGETGFRSHGDGESKCGCGVKHGGLRAAVLRAGTSKSRIRAGPGKTTFRSSPPPVAALRWRSPRTPRGRRRWQRTSPPARRDRRR